jgi:hypothetical protein
LWFALRHLDVVLPVCSAPRRSRNGQPGQVQQMWALLACLDVASHRVRDAGQGYAEHLRQLGSGTLRNVVVAVTDLNQSER